MARRSLRELLRKKREGKKALSPQMRTLLDSFEAQYGQRDPQNEKRSGVDSRESDDATPRSA
jgi:hypothetical protein